VSPECLVPLRPPFPGPDPARRPHATKSDNPTVDRRWNIRCLSRTRHPVLIGIMEQSEQFASVQSEKVRASCDRCQASKVRCSRTKPSCWRCTQGGHACIYGPYRRIGRPPKHQTTKATNNHKSSPNAAPSPATPSREGEDGHGIGDDSVESRFPDVDDPIDANTLRFTGNEDHVTMTMSEASPLRALAAETSSNEMASTIDAMLGIEAVDSESWDATLSSFFLSQITPLLPPLPLQNSQSSPPYSGSGSSTADALWPEATLPISIDSHPAATESPIPNDWFGTGIIAQPTPAPSSSASQRRPSFWQRPSASVLNPRGAATDGSTIPSAWRPALNDGAKMDTIPSGHMAQANSRCAGDCYATLSAQLVSLGALDPTETTPVPFDVLLSAQSAAQEAQTRTLECERCMRGANAQTTLLLLTMAVEKLVALFEAWYEDQGDQSQSSDGVLERDVEPAAHSVPPGSGRVGVEGCGKRGGHMNDKLLLAGSFVVEAHGVKAAFLTHLLGLRLDRLGGMVAELERRVEDGEIKRVGARVAGEMLQDVRRRIFFLKGKVQLSSQ